MNNEDNKNAEIKLLKNQLKKSVCVGCQFEDKTKLILENKQLRELIKLAINDVKNMCNTCVNRAKYSDSYECKDCHCNKFARGDLWKWQWQHADKLKELRVIYDE